MVFKGLAGSEHARGHGSILPDGDYNFSMPDDFDPAYPLGFDGSSTPLHPLAPRPLYVQTHSMPFIHTSDPHLPMTAYPTSSTDLYPGDITPAPYSAHTPLWSAPADSRIMYDHVFDQRNPQPPHYAPTSMPPPPMFHPYGPSQPMSGVSPSLTGRQAPSLKPPQLYSQSSISSEELLPTTPPVPSHKATHQYPAVSTPEEFVPASFNPPAGELSKQHQDPRRHSVIGFVQKPSFGISVTFPVPQRRHSTALHLEDLDEEDDLQDVDMELESQAVSRPDHAHQQMSLMLMRHGAADQVQLRSYTAHFQDENILAHYRPTHSASPLSDDKAAEIFCHFITTTGPSVSIFERSEMSSPVNVNGLPTSAAQKAVWTYKLPAVALSHPALMHAMLALSALHIAKLQHTSEGPSMKHFTYALRRVSKLIGLPRRRNETATLAATLLIGFYEVMLAEHSKWNLHLSGAKILVMEIDFAGLSRKIRRMRSQAKARIAHTPVLSYEDHVRVAGIPETLLPDLHWEVDQRLISDLTGIHIDYDDDWQTGFNLPSADASDMNELQIEEYKTKADLYWWYCKQDVFQSMISGNRLLMPFEHWVKCPPRGQAGKVEATYATMDHLCLLMARLTDFGAKDQLRKRRRDAKTGGQWVPPPGMFGPGKPPGPRPEFSTSSKPAQRPSAPPGVSSKSQPPPSAPPTGFSMPPMYGMMLQQNPPADDMPSAYHTMEANLHNTLPPEHITNPPQPAPPTQALDYELEQALQEHTSLVSAFSRFEPYLTTTDLAPLPADTTLPIPTPFGPALQYRTHAISCIHAFFQAGRILLHRFHPSMPPAAMVAASVAAPLTAHHASAIGRICAGLYIPQAWTLSRAGSAGASVGLNPSLGAALIESTFSLFFAGVQFSDAGQRGWTVAKLCEISRLTGWQSSAAVAAGCEVAWSRMGLAGRGPVYEPTMDRGNKDERVSGWGRKLQRLGRASAVQGNGSVSTYTAEHASASASASADPLQQNESGVVVNASQTQGGPRRFGEGSTWNAEPKGKSREEGGRSEAEDQEPPAISNERRFISSNPSARVHWALGILAVEDDIRKLDLGR